MASSDPAEVALPIDELISQLTRSFTVAAENLKRVMSDPQWRDSPFTYHMPGMTMEIRLTLAYSGTTVKGILHRTKTESAQEVTSTIRLELVAVPNAKAAG